MITERSLRATVRHMLSSLIILSVIILVISSLSGCSRITQENYNKIKVGMEYDEVISILGKPTSCSSVFKATNCAWGNEKRSIEISLVTDRVVLLSSKGL